jgi:hemolysin activation/secretion protein
MSCVLFNSDAQAQSFQHYRQLDRYRYLPRLPEGDENPPPLPDTPTEVTGSDKILVKELKGLVFVDHPDKIQKGKLDVTGVRVDGDLELVNTAEFDRIVGAYIGGGVSIYRLNQMVRDIVLLYRDNDEPVVDVSIPDQDITDGVVQVVVTEGRVGQVRVTGPCFFDPQNLVDQVCISPGDRIYESNLLEDQRWLMRNPFRSVEMELTPGENRGETDVIFNVYDRKPWRWYMGYEDTGNQSTGLERVLTGVNWYNAFNKDDQLGYQYTASPDFSTVDVHSGIYSLALQNRDILTVFGSYGTVFIPAAAPGNTRGQFWQASIRWNRELCPRGCYEHGIQAGFDFKNTNTNLDFGGAIIAASDADVIQFMAGYNGHRHDDLGSMHLGVDFYMSPGNWGGKNDDAQYQAIIPNSNSTYIYSRMIFERRFWLNRGELVARVTGQIASTNLLPPETLGLGGYTSVRGYDQYTFAADSGYFGSVEWWSDPWNCLLGDDELRVLTFFDIGEAWQHNPIMAVPSYDMLQSVGAGARYTLNERLEFRIDYGYKLNTPVGLPQPRSRVHIGAVLSH